MGLDIDSSDDEKHFHIGYIGFTIMRSLFILSHDKEKYEQYLKMVNSSTFWGESDYTDDDWDIFYESLGDLSILINHSDVDGILTSDECKGLLNELNIDIDKIYNDSTIAENNPNACNKYINSMREFKDIVKYAAENNVNLIFG